MLFPKCLPPLRTYCRNAFVGVDVELKRRTEGGDRRPIEEIRSRVEGAEMRRVSFSGSSLAFLKAVTEMNGRTE